MKRFFVALIGGTVIVIGIALLVLPGPGILIIGLGLAILASEFIWARRVLRKARGAVKKAGHRIRLPGWLRRRRKLPEANASA